MMFQVKTLLCNFVCLCPYCAEVCMSWFWGRRQRREKGRQLEKRKEELLKICYLLIMQEYLQPALTTTSLLNNPCVMSTELQLEMLCSGTFNWSTLTRTNFFFLWLQATQLNFHKASRIQGEERLYPIQLTLLLFHT